MSWNHQHMHNALETIPKRLSPDDVVPDFNPLKARIARIERQHFVLSLQEWIETNAVWLDVIDLSVVRSKRRSGPPYVAITLLAHPLHPEAKERLDFQLDKLMELLAVHSIAPHEECIRGTIADLNKAHWAPEHGRSILATKIPDVPHAIDWLTHHSVTRQAKDLAKNAPRLTSPPRRTRL